jgi:uncharacterized protein (TIGR02147 family)
VLSHQAHLTPEQAAGLAEFWKLKPLERDLFLELVHHGRAGTSQLKQMLQDKIERLRIDLQQLEALIEVKQNQFDRALYYSHWRYAAVHMLCSIEQFQTAPAIAKKLGLDIGLVDKTLHELAASGVIQEQAGIWHPVHWNVHADKESAELWHHLFNWRQKALENYKTSDEGVHYTGVHSLSKADYQKLRQMVLDFIAQSNALVKPSKEEELACVNLDFFQL